MAISALSSRGYSILKDSITPEEIQMIKNELTVSPYIAPDYATANNPVKPYKLYQESRNKLYVPKYYGLQKFGVPFVNKLNQGDDINLQFRGQLRPEQSAPVKEILKACADPMKMGGILNLTCASGKCLAKNTPILMYNGTIELVQDIKVGDLLMGDDSTPRHVLTTCKGTEMLYCVYQGSYREPYVVNSSHILSLRYGDKIIDISIKKYLSLDTSERAKLKAYHATIDFDGVAGTAKFPYEYGEQLATASEIMGVKHEYKCGSRLVRGQMLIGFVETIKKNNRKFYNPNNSLVRDMIFVARSLGYNAYAIGSTDMGYRFDFTTKMDPVDVTVQPLQPGEYFGFTLSGNCRFVLGDFTVTHNTVLAIYCICKLAKKTLIIVHKDFLLKQWKERIEEFTNGARVGLIKGKIVDVENKDIVIASLQSLAMKEYTQSVFESFSIVIIDEVHHTAAEVFCRALGKVVFPITIGLTATLKRKDGLTKVFLWYLGDVAYSNVKQLKGESGTVKTRIIRYYDSCKEYSQEIVMFRDKLNVARMINNICEYPARTTLICTLIKEILEDEPLRRILILSDRKAHLNALNASIRENITQDVGFYIGGMKEKSLKESEQKKIIIATFAMSSEGLDIKGLDTLILASPKSDPIQSCGRILRDKPECRKHVPLIIDIVDMFSIFPRQGAKRERYYKSQKYDIVEQEVIVE